MIEMQLQGVDRLNDLDAGAAGEEFLRCCGASRWARQMTERRPFRSGQAVLTTGEAFFEFLDRFDWLEAFAHHPKIGDLSSLRAKFQNTSDWAQGEQAGTSAASDEVLKNLALGNRLYEERFGFIFIICATGKSATQMLAALQARLSNEPNEELRIAAMQQKQITRLRLEKLLGLQN